VNNRLSTRCPKTHVIVLVVIIRISKSGLFVGVVTIGIVILIIFIFVVILVQINVELILILIFLVVVIFIVDIGILVVIELFFFIGLLLYLSSQTSDVVLLGQGVIDSQLDCNGIAVTSDPIVLAGGTTGKLVELRAIRSEVRRVGAEKLGT